ncbi:MAG: hypothetical protein BGN96_01655 [Bacteroidales bacterium 45-6]|nr:MAG: hypothetical protein BGN96_01655 [Bacteroidales bacterium 45-6]
MEEQKKPLLGYVSGTGYTPKKNILYHEVVAIHIESAYAQQIFGILFDFSYCEATTKKLTSAEPYRITLQELQRITRRDPKTIRKAIKELVDTPLVRRVGKFGYAVDFAFYRQEIENITENRPAQGDYKDQANDMLGAIKARLY